jgi:hypothetical protein
MDTLLFGQWFITGTYVGMQFLYHPVNMTVFPERVVHHGQIPIYAKMFFRNGIFFYLARLDEIAPPLNHLYIFFHL